MKLLVAILVVVVQAAGPWLCCCVPARLVATAKAAVCSHCKGTPKTAIASCCDPAPKPSDCCQYCCTPLEPPPAIVAPPIALQQLPETSGEFLPVAELGWASLLAELPASEERPPPFLSVETKLFTHHVLRC